MPNSRALLPAFTVAVAAVVAQTVRALGAPWLIAAACGSVLVATVAIERRRRQRVPRTDAHDCVATWTAAALAQAEHNGARVYRGSGDGEHVVIAHGSVIAVASRWRAERWPLCDRSDWHLRVALRDARRHAETLERDLVDGTGASRVTPVLLLWGGCAGEETTLDGVHVMPGDRFANWFAHRGGARPLTVVRAT